MINKIILIGRLGADPELRYTPQGTPVMSFDIAVNRQFKSSDGNRETDWFTIVTWRSLAELCGQYLKKGSQVAVDGRLQSRVYDNKEGQKVKVYEIVAENVQFLDRMGESGGQAPANFNDHKDPFANNDKVVDLSDDNLPF